MIIVCRVVHLKSVLSEWQFLFFHEPNRCSTADGEGISEHRSQFLWMHPKSSLDASAVLKSRRSLLRSFRRGAETNFLGRELILHLVIHPNAGAPAMPAAVIERKRVRFFMQSSSLGASGQLHRKIDFSDRSVNSSRLRRSFKTVCEKVGLQRE